MTKHRTRNRAGEGSRLRTELIAAAGRVLAAAPDGADLSLRAVAREAGIAAPSVYLQFDDKAALIHAVLNAGFDQLRVAVEAAVAQESEPGRRLRIGCYAYCAFAAAQSGVYRNLFEQGYDDSDSADVLDPLDAGARALGTLVHAIAECMAAGIATSGDPFRLASLLWPALHGYVALRRRRRLAIPWLPMTEQIEDLLVGLVGVPRLPASDLTALAAKLTIDAGVD